VDALCINQQDLDEKAMEVKRIGEFYRKADQVVSYLGEEIDQNGEALELQNAFGEALNNPQSIALISLRFFQNTRTDPALRLAQLLTRPYWTRIWIVQEISMASEKSITICGPRRFPTKNLLKGCKSLVSGPGTGLLNGRSRLGQDYES
jgi:hypothetical protein